MAKKIIFKARSKSESRIQQRPFPASEAIPSWWRDMTPYDVTPDNPEGKKLMLSNRSPNVTFKKCAPLLDGITSGYIIPLWADVMVTQTPENPLLTWKTHRDVFEVHGPSSRLMPAPPGYDQFVLKYMNAWIPITPPGYSIMVTSPLGHRGLPFMAIPAVIDSDKSTLELVLPVWVKTGFEGIVEAGTPIAQITPFKRDNWKAEFDSYEDNEYYSVIEESNFNKTIVNHYIKNHWSKKSYK